METIEEAQFLPSLVKLQNLYLEIENLRRRAARIPEESAALEQELTVFEGRVREGEARLEESRKERKRLEGEVETLRHKLSRLKGQLMEVKTNAEYQAMQHEIAYVQEQILAKEDAILEQMIAGEDLEGDLARAREELAAARERIHAERRELEGFLLTAERQVEEMLREISSLEESIPAELLQRFRKIAEVRNGIALAAVQNQSCQACHVRLRPQLIAEIKTNRGLYQCENCHRILYLAPAG